MSQEVKIKMEPTSMEKEMAEKLFGKTNLKPLEHVNSPMAIPYLCHRKDLGFVGEDLGFSEKICNEFFPTPTDQGICLTKNLDIEELMKPNPLFGTIFESEYQQSSGKMDGGVLWSEMTLVLNAEWGTPEEQLYTRIPKDNILDDIEFQIHQPSELGNILTASNDNQQQSSITLEANNEYIIEVTPIGQIKSEAFKETHIHQRQCHTPSEVQEKSIFKMYTQKNCQYECHVNMAIGICQCLPWDFMSNIQAEECDIFGRTCFYNAMKDFTQSLNDSCSHCLKDCDFYKYKKTVISKTQIQNSGNDNPSFWWRHLEGKRCMGSKIFCDLILDKNFTLKDKGLESIIGAFGYAKPNFRGINSGYNLEKIYGLIRNLIIVHLRFNPPEVEKIELKYSTMDKFANFGGNFGIFSEITGCSLIALVNVFIILIKIIISICKC